MTTLNPSYNPPPRGMVSNIRSFYVQGYEDGYADGVASHKGSHNSHAGLTFESDVEHTGQLGPVKVKKRKRNKWVYSLSVSNSERKEG